MLLTISNIKSRTREIAAYMAASHTLVDAPKMALLGFSRRHPFSGADIMAKLCRRLFPFLVVRPKRFCGIPILLNPSDVSHVIIAEEFIIDKLYNLSRIPFEPKTVFDCGAHIGFFTSLAAAQFQSASITAFEPAPANLHWFRRQSAALSQRTKIVAAAVSDRDVVARFKNSCSFGGQLEHDNHDNDSYEVKVIDLLPYIQNVGDLLLLKMDIEGEEEVVLPHIVPSLPESTALFLEVHGGDDSWKRAARLLETHGFHTTIDRVRDRCIDGYAVRHIKAATSFLQR
jgi:FkbM family methyltransferase